MNIMKIKYLLILTLTLVFSFLKLSALENKKVRVIVLTDIEADPDDSQSLIRFLLYANQWDVEGIIATTSIHQKNFVSPESVIDILKAYQFVQPNLSKHETGYPSYDDLVSKVKKGLPVYGMEGVGKDKDSQGSEWIIQQLEKEDPRPV
jgi:hypothetical protein